MSKLESIKEYTEERQLELDIVQYINNVWSKGKWELQQTTFNDDMKGIDAYGIEKNKTKEDTKLLVQIKAHSFLALSELERYMYIKKVATNMNKHDPTASRRLIIYKRAGRSIRIWNYSIDKMVKPAS